MCFECTYMIIVRDDSKITDWIQFISFIALKSSMIFPATRKHIEKYKRQEVHLLRETADDYNLITRPYIESTQFSTQWVHNILEKKTESERIVFEDPHPNNGKKQTHDLLKHDLKHLIIHKLFCRIYLIARHEVGWKAVRKPLSCCNRSPSRRPIVENPSFRTPAASAQHPSQWHGSFSKLIVP